MNISDISFATRESSPYFFSRETLRFFGQRMSSFRVWKGKSGAFYVAAPSYWNDNGQSRMMGVTFRKFTGTDLVNVDTPKFQDMEDAKEWVKANG
jgi:hypothetical protein